ncbi:MAG: Rrf2 family transcriptional regulator [Lentisphaerae bacterium]|nr:Rrf2 family transcriptional regulator [Lentisphaerota bacterium]
MMALSQTTGYAVQALACLATQREATCAVRHIARQSGVPAPYLSKIIHALCRAGIVTAKRGASGGVRLARQPVAITLLDVSESVDGPDYFTRCLLGLDTCSDERDCPTHRFWKSTRGRIRDQLARITLADVVAFNRRRQVAATARTKS